MKEIWKDIKGYEGLYQVSNLGKVKSLDRWIHYSDDRMIFTKGQLLKIFKDKNGYQILILHKNGERINHKVHRLVAEAFIPNPHNYPQVNHKDENKTNNIVWINEDGSINFEKSNLEWCDCKYNINYGNHRINNKNAQHNKPILQYDLDGNLIKEWFSSRDIQRELGYNRANIMSVCQKRKYCKSAFGYIWKYADN